MTMIIKIYRTDLSPENIEFTRTIVKRFPSPDNQYIFALMLHDTGDESHYKEMFENLEKASNAGHADARSLLGDCYFFGLGVEKDQKKGIDLFISAADNGSLLGCYSAGNELLIGKIVKPEYDKAYRYLKKAADNGDDRAINSLGIMYVFGYHVGKNLKIAKRLFKKSTKMGNKQADFNYRKLKAAGKGADFSGEPILKPSEIQEVGKI